MNIKEIMKKRWYAQGFNCTPILLLPCGSSGFYLNEVLGDSFKNFMYEYKNEFGKMYYPIDDLERLCEIIIEKLEKDKDFLKKTKAEYEKEFWFYFNKIINIDLSKLSDEEIIGILKKAEDTLTASVRLAHIIEPFSLSTDTKIKNMLASYAKSDKELNAYLSVLSAPTKKSFVNESEEYLKKIKDIKNPGKRKEKIADYIKKFYWVHNSYSGRIVMTEKNVEEDLKSIYRANEIRIEDIKKKKKDLIKRLNLDKGIIMLLEASDFVAQWQDSRKRRILMAIDRAEEILEELSKRMGIEVKFLRYLSVPEINNELLKNKNLKEILENRRNGVAFISTPSEEVIMIGDDYISFHEDMNKSGEFNENNDLHGIIASTGTAIGYARVCKSIEDIASFKDGEILIATMTRPEFVPAMKKAAAVVTDEGGITSHAAIISREFGIPCVIGTKIATKVIKNGDRIEVRANHGLVRIIK